MQIKITTLYLILLFYISPFIDAISGYLVLSEIISEGGVGSPSQIFRFLLLLISLKITFKNKIFFNIILFIIFYIIIIEFIFFMVHNNLYGYIIGLVYGNKLVYLLLIYTSLLILFKTNVISFLILLKYIRNYVLITSIILTLSFISGLGFNTYDEGTFGFKGFYAAGNGLGIFQGIGLLLSVYYWKITKEKFALISIFIIVFATTIIGSKTALFLSVLSLLSIVFLQKSIFIKGIIVFILFLLFTIFIDQILSSFKIVFDVIIFRFNNSESVFSWLFSNRDNYLISALNSFSLDGILILRVLVGFGAFISFRNPRGTYQSIDILESDFLDIFFMYGIIFLLIYIIFITSHIYIAFMKKKFFISLIFLLLMTHSIMAGHILFNGMSGILVPLLSLLIINSKKE
jgi:hypothetical protein